MRTSGRSRSPSTLPCTRTQLLLHIAGIRCGILGACSQALQRFDGAVFSDGARLTAQDAAFLLGTPLVVKPREHTTDVRAPLRVVANRRKLDRRAAPEKSLDLLNRAKLRFVHVDHHPPDNQPDSRVTRHPILPPSGSHFFGNTPSRSGSYLIGQGIHWTRLTVAIRAICPRMNWWPLAWTLLNLRPPFSCTNMCLPVKEGGEGFV